MSEQYILDACCGTRAFWFEREDERVLFMDRRSETHIVSGGGNQPRRVLRVAPNIIADFSKMPFADEQFYLVIFDPPHLRNAGKNGWQAKKYGKLEGEWAEMLRKGFSECFRVLRPNGVLIFKWNEEDVRVSQILSLTSERPLFGNRCGKLSKSHWIVFMKPTTSPIVAVVHDDARPAEVTRKDL